MRWYLVPDLQSTSEPFIKRVNITGNSICVVGYKGELFALSAQCPHQGFDLGSGWCENGKLICPLHGYAFDLQTGKGPNDYLKTYAVKVKDGQVFVGIRSVWDDIKQLFVK